MGDDRLVGKWIADEGYKTVELMFRPDGGYQVQTKGTDSDFEIEDRGRYEVMGQSLTMTSDQYFQEQVPAVYRLELSAGALSLAGSESDLPWEYQLQPGSRAEVLGREKATPDLYRR